MVASTRVVPTCLITKGILAIAALMMTIITPTSAFHFSSLVSSSTFPSLSPLSPTLNQGMHRTSSRAISSSTITTKSHYNHKNNIRNSNSNNNSNNIKNTSPLYSVEGDFDPDVLQRSVSEAQAGSIKAKLRALYKFTRPHTIRGTILASIAGTIRALLDTPGSIANANWGLLLPRAMLGMVALLLGNAFIVGINQIYDDDIDKLNKPFLPVASGEMSKKFAWLTVAIAGIVGPVLVKTFFPPILFKLYMLGWFLGGIYSVPPIRTKQNPILAGLTIATVRGFLLNFGVYYAVKDAIAVAGPSLSSSLPFVWSPKVAFMARFMTIFAACIAVTKDLPDVQGDRAFQISTFATQVGVGKIAKGATALLLLNYGHAIVTGIASAAASGTFNLIPMIGGHASLAAMLMVRYQQLDPDSMKSIKVYYKHIWDLFYLEYVLYTLI